MDENKIMISNLEQKPQLLTQVLNLIEECFEYGEGFSFLNDFFPLLNIENHANCWLLLHEETQELIGHIGAREVNLSVKDGSFPCVFLGGIAIKKQFQGKGLFKYFFNAILNNYETDHSMLCLWSNKPELYQRFGFELATTIEVTTGSRKTIDWKKNTSFNEFTEEEFKQIRTCYENFTEQFATIERTSDDWFNLQEMEALEIFTHKTDNKIDAYFVRGKGFDLQNIAHEFGYANDEGKNFLEEMLKGQICWLPEGALESLERQSMNFAMMVRPGAFYPDFIKHISAGAIEVTELTDTGAIFHYKGEDYQYLMAEFLPMILGPNPVDEFKSFYTPFYISGLDSI